MGANDPKSPLPIEARELPSNTWMPGVTPLTTPNNSSIGSHTSAKLRSKGPTGYNGTPKFTPKTAPSPSMIITHLIHPSLDQPYSPSQTASGSNQPFCHNTLCRQIDQLTWQTDRWFRRMFHNMSTPLAMLIESYSDIMFAFSVCFIICISKNMSYLSNY